MRSDKKMIKWGGETRAGQDKESVGEMREQRRRRRKWNPVKDKESQVNWTSRIRVRNETGKGDSGYFLLLRGKAQPLTVSVVEHNDASLFGLRLLWVHHSGADDKIHWRVFSQTTRHHAEGVLAGEELVGVENWWRDKTPILSASVWSARITCLRLTTCGRSRADTRDNTSGHRSRQVLQKRTV